MPIKKLPLNPNGEKKLLDKVEDYFWDNKKTELLELILEGENSLKRISNKLMVSERELRNWMNHPRFMERYSRILGITMQRIEGKRLAMTEEFMRVLDQALEIIREKIENLDPDKTLEVLRKFLSLEPGQKLPRTQIQQNIIARDQSIKAIISPEAIKLFEEAVERKRGFKPLKVSEVEIKEIQEHGSDFPKFEGNRPSRTPQPGIDSELVGNDGAEDTEKKAD